MYSIGVVILWSRKFDWKMKKNIISIIASIKSAKLGCSTIRRTSFSYWAQLDPKMLQKHPIFRGGPVPPKNDYFSKIFVPRDLSTRKPPVYEFWAIFLKIEILLRINLSLKMIILQFLCLFLVTTASLLRYGADEKRNWALDAFRVSWKFRIINLSE